MRCKECEEKFIPANFLQKFCRNSIECKTAEGLFNLDKIKKAEKKRFNEFKESVRPSSHSKENKKNLQTSINELARKIDSEFGYEICIDCSKPYGKQIDAGHFHSVGSDASLRFNLHNIHSQKSDCNRNGLGGGRQLGYMRGLQRRYGDQYAEYVEFEIKRTYNYIGLNEIEIYEKLKLVRAIVRNFETYKFKNSLHARDMFNILIGIYTKKRTNDNKQKNSEDPLQD